MGRNPCCSKEGLNRGAWTAIEDQILTDFVKTHGEGKWRNLPKKAGLKRCGKSCRLRWLNYLRPDIKRGNISSDEEDLIIRLQKLLGNRWSLIAGRLPGRTDNEIKNYWNTNLGKKVERQKNSTQTPTSSKDTPMPSQLKTNSEPNEIEDVEAKPSIKSGELEFTKKENNLGDFTIDFNLDELSFSDIYLNSGFSDIGEFFYDSSTCSDQPEIIGDWSLYVNGNENVDANLHSVASFLDLGGEWIQ